MKNLKNVMVALAAAMLATVAAPIASADHDECAETATMGKVASTDNYRASGNLGTSTIVLRLDAAPGDANFAIARIVDPTQVEVTIWKEPTSGGTCSEVVDEDGLTLDADANFDYYVRLVRTSGSADTPYDISLIKQ